MSVKERLKQWVDTLTDEEAQIYLQRWVEEEAEDLKAYEDGLKDAEENGTIPWRQARKELGFS